MFIFFLIFLDLPNMTGKVAIVTGGSRGIGTVVVKMLLQCGADVIIGDETTKLLLSNLFLSF